MSFTLRSYLSREPLERKCCSGAQASKARLGRLVEPRRRSCCPSWGPSTDLCAVYWTPKKPRVEGQKKKRPKVKRQIYSRRWNKLVKLEKGAGQEMRDGRDVLRRSTAQD